jgi:cell division protein FtsW
MAKKRTPDFVLLSICCALLFAGILILASVSASFSLQKTGTTFYFLNHQLLFGLLPGIFLAAAAFFTPLSFIRKWSVLLLIGNIMLLGMVFLPGIGGEAASAHRWIYIGSFSFQPSELLKITFILYMASWLATKNLSFQQNRPTASRSKSTNPSIKETLLPFSIILGVISLFLILQPDVSTLGVIATTGLVMYFLAGTPFWHSLLLIGVGLGSLMALIAIAPYRASRLAVFLDPSLDPLGKGYQVKQALIGIGSGGLTGTGLGLSFQKFGVLPEPISDSIFAVFAEEMGFIGSFLLITLLFAFAWRVLVISRRVPDTFAKLAAAGIGFWLFFQATINIGSMLGILPLTGIPLPFISYGGSALIAELIAMGILLNISKQA